MGKTKIAGAALAGAVAMLGPLGAVPAHAWVCDLYPCETVRDTAAFVRQEADDAVVFGGDVVFGVACLAFPTRPECQ
jgi:hypothetical protein